MSSSSKTSDFDVITDETGTWHQLAVQLDDNLDEVYALLCAILDRVQLSGQSFAEAIEESLDSLTGILAVRHSLYPREAGRPVRGAVDTPGPGGGQRRRRRHGFVAWTPR